MSVGLHRHDQLLLLGREIVTGISDSARRRSYGREREASVVAGVGLDRLVAVRGFYCSS